MSSLKEKLDISDFEVEDIDISKLDTIKSLLPQNGVIDLNIAEQGLMQCLWAQDFCQEHIIRIDRIISRNESRRDKFMAEAGLIKAKDSGYKTAKDKEWFAKSDADYIAACNDIALAKAGKKFFENKASFFSGWYFAFKTFLSRDYTLERLSRDNFGGSLPSAAPSPKEDVVGEIDWDL